MLEDYQRRSVTVSMILPACSALQNPNADIEAITSAIHLKTGNLTKEDLIIFLGGTKDISRNEAKKKKTAFPKGFYTKNYEYKSNFTWSPPTDMICHPNHV
jgi:hypothetical protein